MSYPTFGQLIAVCDYMDTAKTPNSKSQRGVKKYVLSFVRLWFDLAILFVEHVCLSIC